MSEKIKIEKNKNPIMKKIILLLLIFSTSVTSAQKIKYGIKAGLNISSLRADYLDETNAKSKTGFHSGVFVEYAFNENFSIQPELLYSTQGGESDSKKYDEADFYLGINPVPQLSYLNFPIMLKYEFVEKLHVELGPQIGYLLSAKSNIEYIDSSRKETLEIDILNGEPGIYSARWGGKKNNFNLAINKVYRELNKIDENWYKKKITAQFVCALTIYWPNNFSVYVVGKVKGTISKTKKGNNGFGYDPIFIPLNSRLTFGEISPTKKYKIDHRMKAFKKIKKFF